MCDEIGETVKSHAAEGRYADDFRIGYSAYRFVLEFGQVNSDGRETNYHTKLILAPDNTKTLLGNLKKSMSQYEIHFGRVNKSEE